MFIQLLYKRLKVTLVPLMCLISAIAVCIFCMHLFFLLYQNLSTGVVHHTKLTPIIVAPSTSTKEILNQTLFLQQMPTKTIDNELFLNHPEINHSAPLYFGERYKGFKVIGTTSSLFLFLTKNSSISFKESSDVIIGSDVAKKLKLTVGSELHIHHHSHDHNHVDLYVTTILPDTNSNFDSVVFISKEAFLSFHEGESVYLNSPHFYWLSPKQPILTYSILNYLNQFSDISAVSSYLAKREIVRSFMPLKSLFKLALNCLIIITFLQSIMMFLFNARRYFDEFKVLFHSGASPLFLTIQLFSEFFIIFLTGSLLGIILSSVSLAIFKESFQFLIGYPVYLYTLPFSSYMLSLGLFLFISTLITFVSISLLIQRRDFIRL